MGELQDRRDAQTREELSNVAIALFAAEGYAETTMDDVAKSAGVSRRTVYRHYANKADLLFEQARIWLDVFDQATNSRQQDESLRHVCVRGLIAVSNHIVENQEQILAGLGVILTTPALHARYAGTNRAWLERYVELFTPDDGGDEESRLEAAILAGALVGGTDGAVVEWALHPGSDLVAMIETMVAKIEPLWPKV